MTRKEKKRFFWKLFYLSLFAIAMGYLESAIVIYLRKIYYSDGFNFPLKLIPEKMAAIEFCREAATILMLMAVAALTSRRFWERFGFFIFVFGIWDIFFYFWLKVILNWPGSLNDFDILFLIPVPWIGPVWAPLLISLLMVISGYLIVRLYQSDLSFKSSLATWLLTLGGIAIILYTFIMDNEAGTGQASPMPFSIYQFAIGYIACLIGFVLSYRKSMIKAA